MIAGQADDIAFEKRRDVSVEQCMAMSAAKTGALLGCAASIGAILAGAPDATVGALRDYGRHLGLAFQAVDDLLGIWGDPARTGKPAGSDLRQRKKSMPVVSALAAGGDGGRRAAGPDRSAPAGDAGARSRRSTPTRSSGPPTWSRRAAAGSGPRCGPRPIWTPPSAPSSGCACRRSPTASWPTSPCTWWSESRDRRVSARRAPTGLERIYGAEPTAPSLAAARDHLLGLQDPDGWWKAELETNVTMDAEDLMLRHFLGILDPEAAGGVGARGSGANQRDDGTWGTFYGGPADLSDHGRGLRRRCAWPATTPDAPHMRAAAAWVRAHGGHRGQPGVHPDLAGHGRPVGLGRPPVLPPEIMFLPSWAPLNIYDFGCWARQTVVALTVVMAHRPARPLPFGIDELRARARRRPRRPARRGWPCASPGGRFEPLDRSLHHYERLPGVVRPPHACCAGPRCGRAEQWIVRRQEADGLWGGIQPPVVYSIIALHLQGYPLDHPVMRAALAGLDGFIIDDDRGRRVEACQSPVWDTALAVVALADAGVDADDPALVAGRRDGCSTRRSRSPGTGLCAGPGWRPAGGRSSSPTTTTPTSTTPPRSILALRRAGRGRGRPRVTTACARGVAWTVGMQSRGRRMGRPSTPTTTALWWPPSPSATSARSPTRPRPTSPPT